MQIPKAKIRALHENGQAQDRALTDADGIHVAAVIPRRAAGHRLASRSHADDPDHGIQGEFHAHKSEMPIGYGTDARVPLHPIRQGSSARRRHERPGLLGADGPDMHAEHVPGSAPSTTIGPVAGFTCEKLSRAFGCPSSVTCPLKQSQVSTVSEQGAVTVATGSETPKL